MVSDYNLAWKVIYNYMKKKKNCDGGKQSQKSDSLRWRVTFYERLPYTENKLRLKTTFG